MEIVFTKHARERMRKRNISEEEVTHALQYPDKTFKIEGKYHIQKDLRQVKIEVVCIKEKYIKVITVYAT